MKIPPSWLRGALLIAALATAYYYIASIFGAVLPWVPPSWWLSHWTSRAVGAFLWLEILNVAMAAVAALPVAIAVCWIIKAGRNLFALAIAAAAALGWLVSLFVSDLSPIGSGSNHLMEIWLDVIVHVLSLALAVPLFVWIFSCLPSNHPLERTRS